MVEPRMFQKSPWALWKSSQGKEAEVQRWRSSWMYLPPLALEPAVDVSVAGEASEEEGCCGSCGHGTAKWVVGLFAVFLCLTAPMMAESLSASISATGSATRMSMSP